MRIAFFGTSGAIPGESNGNTSFLIDTNGKLILVDASGNPVQNIFKAKKNPDDLWIIIITHAHVDHIYGLPSLIHTLYCMGRKRDLLVLSDPATTEKAKMLLEFFNLNSSRIGFSLVYEKIFSAPGFKLKLIPGNHTVPSSMVLAEEGAVRLLYTSDTASTDNVRKAVRRCNILIHEASGSHASVEELEEDGHSSGYQAGMNAVYAGVEKLFLCHFAASGAEEPELMKEEAKKAFKEDIVLPQAFKWYEL